MDKPMQQGFMRISRIEKLSSKYVIDEKTVKELASTTIIPFVSRKFQLKKQAHEEKYIANIPHTLPVLIIFNRTLSNARRLQGQEFMQNLKINCFVGKINDLMMAKKITMIRDGFRIIKRESSQLIRFEAFCRIERLLYRKLLNNKGYFFRSLSINLFESRISLKPSPSVSRTLKKEKPFQQILTPKVPKPFKQQELYENVARKREYNVRWERY